MIEVCLVDSFTKRPLKVNGENELSVTTHSHPNINEEIESYPFAEWFTNNSSNDLRVDGSTTPQEFSVSAINDADLFIKTIDLQISDQTANLSKFGALTALTNGVSFTYNTPQTGEIVIFDEMKTNLDLIRLFSDTPAIGTGSDAFLVDLSGSNADTYLMRLDLTKVFGYPWGVRLLKSSVSKLSFTIKDDLSTGIDVFNIRAFGIQL